jgi:hypothetical protein
MKSLDDAGFNPKPCFLPFPLKFELQAGAPPKIIGYWSYCNGLVNTYQSGQVQYLMPVFNMAAATERNHPMLKKAESDAITLINSIPNVEAIRIYDAKLYGKPGDSALRCSVKVLSRELL